MRPQAIRPPPQMAEGEHVGAKLEPVGERCVGRAQTATPMNGAWLEVAVAPIWRTMRATGNRRGPQLRCIAGGVRLMTVVPFGQRRGLMMFSVAPRRRKGKSITGPLRGRPLPWT